MPAIASHSTPTTDAAWDGPANKARLPNQDGEAAYRKAFAWYDGGAADPNGDGYPDNKGDWKFIHHMVSAGGSVGAASTVACSAGIGVLNGARGGTTIPDADRRGVYDHLGRHLRDAGLAVPDLRSAGPSIDELRKALPKMERRMIPLATSRIALRTIEDTGPVISMFIPFNSPSVQMAGFTERIAPGAFARTIKNGRSAKQGNDIVALWNHDSNWPLARQANETLDLAESEEGLQADAQLDGDDPMHRHFARRVERRDVQGSSFGFETVRDEWEYDKQGGLASRTLLEVRLYDVSPVTFPAYPASDAEKRSAAMDAAAVRFGVDLGELAQLLQEARAGQLSEQARAGVRRWIAKLEASLTRQPPVTQDVDWDAKLSLRERFLRAGA